MSIHPAVSDHGRINEWCGTHQLFIINTQGKLIISLLLRLMPWDINISPDQYHANAMSLCVILKPFYPWNICLKMSVLVDMCAPIIQNMHLFYVYVFLFLFHVPYEAHVLITFVLHALLFCLPDFSLNLFFFSKDRERDEKEKKNNSL